VKTEIRTSIIGCLLNRKVSEIDLGGGNRVAKESRGNGMREGHYE